MRTYGSRIGRGVRGAVVAAVALAACLAEAKQLKVLAIGNSFSLSMMEELPRAAAAYPGCELDIVHLMIGGCTLERHWANVEKADRDPSFRPYGVTASYAFDKARAEGFPRKANVPEMLVADRWDIVTIQQGSRACWSYETYQPFADRLIARIRELAPQAEIRIQQTWSYSPYSRRLEGWKLTPESMYEALKAAYGRLASEHAFAVIPTGDAVQLYRESLPVRYGKVLSSNEVAALTSPADVDFHGDVVGAARLNRTGRVGIDAHHLNAEGKYLQACVWLAALFDVDVTKLAYEPAIEGFAARARLMRQCAAAAVRDCKPKTPLPKIVYQSYPDAKVRINYDAARIPGYELEDPLVFTNGAPVKTADDWAARRREILDIFSREMYGRRPPEPEAVVADLVDEKVTEGGTVLRRQHEMCFRADRTGPKVRWITFLPRGAKGKVPVILFLNFHGNQSLVDDPDIPLMTAWHRNGAWAKDNRVLPESRGMMQRPADSDTAFPLAEFVRRGYAVMSACYCEVSPDPNREGTEDPRARQDALAYTGVFGLWPKRDPGGLSETTSLGAWSWALSRGLDLAERQEEIDAKRSVVTGCSRLAKAALLAAAYDERFAVCVPVQTGGGGAPLAKRDFGENPATETRQFTHWFCGAYAKYAREPWNTLTFDQHLLLSAVAPRALLVLGFDKPWFDTEGEFLACRAASRVWRTFCGEGLPDVGFPADLDVSAVGPKLGYARRPGPHAIAMQDWTWLMDFADVQFGRIAEFPKPAVGREDFQSMIDAAALRGGGRVTVPAGRHVTGGLRLRSNVELHLEKGAVLEGSSRKADYPVVELPCSEGKWMAVVMAVGETNVAVTGAGEIYGNGRMFPRIPGRLQEGTRPRGLFFGNCRDVRLEGFTLRDSGSWGCVVQCCDGVSIRRLRIDNHASYNNDGIDLEARNAVIADCDIDAGDDGICLKSNNPDFTVENVLVTNCVVRSFCTPLKLGTASHGIVRNVLMAGCRVEAPRRDHSQTRDPLRFDPAYWRPWCVADMPGSVAGEPAGFSAIAIECVDGGLVDGFTCRDIRIDGGCLMPVFIRADRRMSRATGAPRGTHDVLRNVLIENVSGHVLSAVPSIVSGLPDFRIRNVTFRNVRLVSRGIGNYAGLCETPPLELSNRTPMAGMFRQALPARGLWARHVDNLKLENVSFETDTRPVTVLDDVTPPVPPAAADSGSVDLSFDRPLASGHLNFCDNLRRFDVPLERPMDLSSAGGVAFELKCQDPAVIENVWLLMKSGAGYYRAAAAKPAEAGVWTRTVVAKDDVRLYHWDAHMSLWEKVERPDEKDLPDWSRVEDFQVVVAIDIDATSGDASVAARGFRPVAGPVPPRPPVPPAERIAAQPGERRLICTHVWGVDHDWDGTCRDLAPYGITDVSPLIAHGGYAYYRTRFGVEHPLVAKYGDALRLSVAACHKYGMKCHPRRSCWSLGFHASPETLAAFRKEGRLQVGFDGKDGAWLCPTHEANLRREVEGMLELAEAGADGIMIDFFRYPNADFCFCPRCRARFEKRLGRTVGPWPQAVRSDAALAAEWSRFRCDVMSEAFNEVSRQVKAVAPRLELSAAVAATVKGAEDRGQDWPRWCRDGGLDVLYPMCYYSTDKMLKRDLVGLSAAVAGTRTKLVPMICFASGDIPFVEPDGFARQIGVLRAAGIRDRAFFRLQEYAPTCLRAVFGESHAEGAEHAE